MELCVCACFSTNTFPNCAQVGSMLSMDTESYNNLSRDAKLPNRYDAFNHSPFLSNFTNFTMFMQWYSLEFLMTTFHGVLDGFNQRKNSPRIRSICGIYKANEDSGDFSCNLRYSTTFNHLVFIWNPFCKLGTLCHLKSSGWIFLSTWKSLCNSHLV